MCAVCDCVSMSSMRTEKRIIILLSSTQQVWRIWWPILRDTLTPPGIPCLGVGPGDRLPFFTRQRAGRRPGIHRLSCIQYTEYHVSIFYFIIRHLNVRYSLSGNSFFIFSILLSF